jgi:DNA repair protein RecO (recombination protein O)
MADFSESSRVLTLFTREFGKVSAIAKGAKRLKGPFAAAIDLLAHCQVVFLRKSSSGLDILTEAQLVTRFSPGQGRLGSLYAGYYIAELLDALSEEYDAHPVLFDEAISLLDLLQHDDQMPLCVLRFEAVILREIGQLPSLENCLVCDEPLAGTSRFAFRPVQGGFLCPSCLGDHPARHVVSAGAIAALRGLAAESGTQWQRLELSPAQLAELRAIHNSSIAAILNRHPKMLRYLTF